MTSLQVAEHFGKEHKHVLRDIRIILEADEDGFSESNFGLSSYLTEQNKEMPMYVMSKDGFVLLVMGYTGPEAMRMKKAYIARFNEMEKALQANAPTSLPEALRAYANMLEENELIRRQRDEAIRTKAWIRDKKTAAFRRSCFSPARHGDINGDPLHLFQRRTGIKPIFQCLTLADN